MHPQVWVAVKAHEAVTFLDSQPHQDTLSGFPVPVALHHGEICKEYSGHKQCIRENEYCISWPISLGRVVQSKT